MEDFEKWLLAILSVAIAAILVLYLIYMSFSFECKKTMKDKSAAEIVVACRG